MKIMFLVFGTAPGFAQGNVMFVALLKGLFGDYVLLVLDFLSKSKSHVFSF